MKNSLQGIGSMLRQFLWKYHFTLFLVFAAGGATLGIYSLLGVINLSTPANANQSSQDTFDQATINRVKKLSSSADEQNFTLPTNQRTDPFLEK